MNTVSDTTRRYHCYIGRSIEPLKEQLPSPVVRVPREPLEHLGNKRRNRLGKSIAVDPESEI